MVSPTTNRHVNRNAADVRKTLLSWQEALAILEDCDERGVPKPFAIAFCTADEGAGTGGELIRYQKAIWHVKNGRVQTSETFERIGPKPTKSPRANPGRANPGRANWIRKIRGLDTDQIRNVFVHLILEINGQPVR